jgi:hypothetical protein
VSQCNHRLGGVNIYQEDLNDFLVITEELELKGLTGSGNEELDNESPQFEPEQQMKIDGGWTCKMCNKKISNKHT